MTFKRLLWLALAGPTVAVAGIPVSEEITCPIGGEVFEITDTLSCSSSGRRTMSFAPITSCDFVTKLPQCPDNFLPIYKDFSDADLVLLRDYMLTESYDSSVDQSRFYLAYIIEKYIGDDPALAFGLLLQGLWFDPEKSFSDPLYLDSFFYEALAEVNRIPAENHPYVYAIMAFAYAKSGQADQAKTHLKMARAIPSEDALLAAYILQVETCIQGPQVAQCAPNQPITIE